MADLNKFGILKAEVMKVVRTYCSNDTKKRINGMFDSLQTEISSDAVTIGSLESDRNTANDEVAALKETVTKTLASYELLEAENKELRKLAEANVDKLAKELKPEIEKAVEEVEKQIEEAKEEIQEEIKEAEKVEEAKKEE